MALSGARIEGRQMTTRVSRAALVRGRRNAAELTRQARPCALVAAQILTSSNIPELTQSA